MAFAVELKNVAPALNGFAEALKKSTGQGGWSFKIEDPGVFAASFTQVTANKITTELAAASGSVFKYVVDKVEELCKDELYRDALLESASSRQVVVRVNKGANANTNNRPIGVAFNNGVFEVVQQAGMELGGGKAYVNEALRAVLGARPSGGMPLALRKELRDLAPAFKTFSERLVKATGVTATWSFELEDLPAWAAAFPTLGAAKLVPELGGLNNSILRAVVDKAEAVLKDATLKEAFVDATTGSKIVLKLVSTAPEGGRPVGATFANGALHVLQQTGKELGGGMLGAGANRLIMRHAGKNYFEDTLKNALNKLSTGGPPLALKVELRAVAATMQSWQERLEKATGVKPWSFEIEVRVRFYLCANLSVVK